MKKKEIDLQKIQQTKEELKEVNKLLDDYFKKEMKRKREEKLKDFSPAERSAYTSGFLDGTIEANGSY
ncbi:MAG: hypothetical protein AAB383_00450 [Patescibacteria group bacterium]